MYDYPFTIQSIGNRNAIDIMRYVGLSGEPLVREERQDDVNVLSVNVENDFSIEDLTKIPSTYDGITWQDYANMYWPGTWDSFRTESGWISTNQSPEVALTNDEIMAYCLMPATSGIDKIFEYLDVITLRDAEGRIEDELTWTDVVESTTFRHATQLENFYGAKVPSLGGLFFKMGGGLQSDYRSLHASNAVGVSCLQLVLDSTCSGIRLELGSYSYLRHL